MWRIKKKKEDKKVQKVKTGSATGTVNVGVSSGTINIGNNPLGGTVNVGHNSGVGATGTINLGVSSTTVNIATTQGGAVNVGNIFSTGTTSLSNPTTSIGVTISGTTSILSPTINIGAAVGSTISIGTNTGITNLGTTNVTTLNGTAASTDMTIGGNLTNGSIAIGQNAAFIGTIAIGSASSTRVNGINIGTLGSGGITIGNVAAPLILNGSSIAIGNTLTSGDVNIAAGGTFTGNVYIAGGNNSRTGTIGIGTAGAGAITLGNVAAPLTLNATSLSINGSSIAIGNTLTSGDVNIAAGGSFTGNVYIAGGSNDRIGTANFATAGTGNVNIGNIAAPLALRGSTTTLSSPLTLGSRPTAGSTTQLGSYSTVNGTNVSGSANFQELTRFTNLPIGVYIVSGSSFINSSAWTAALQFGTSPTTQNAGLTNLQSFSGASAGVILLTLIWVQDSVQNVYFSGSGAVANFQNIQATYVRIA